jgi:hypothetical protein
VEPSAYRCATVSLGELEQLRRIEDVIRLGRVTALESTGIVLERGSVPSDPWCLYVDCSASAISATPKAPVFDGETIRLLPVRSCQPVFSAALIAYVESHVTIPAEKNALCGVVPIPSVPVDWIRIFAANARNRKRWSEHDGLSQWMSRTRLDNRRDILAVGEDDVETRAAIGRYRASVKPAIEKLPQLLAAIA